MVLDATIAEVNTRLKGGRHRVRVERKRNSLFLRATLPDRATPTQTRQQYVALGLEACLTQVEKAESEAIRLSLALRTGTFAWATWDPTEAGNSGHVLTVADFRATAERLHASKYRKDPERGTNAWGKKWAPMLKKLPTVGPVNERILMNVIRAMPEGSAVRRDQGNLLCQVARAMGIPHEELRAAYRGYGAAQLTKRAIPTDPQIEAAFERIRSPHWRWVWGMCAAFGLRPHECAALEWLEGDWIKIHDKTKTGARQVTACPSAWIERFKLRNPQRPTQNASTLSKAFNQALARNGVTIRPYSLRHGFALRLMDKGVPPELGARLMGHSLQLHEQTYKRWLEADRITRAMDRFNL